MSTNDLTLAACAYREVQAQLRLRGEASACAIFEATRANLDLPEEECGLEIFGAMSLAIRRGLVDCNTFDQVENSIVYGAQTVLTPAFPVLQ